MNTVSEQRKVVVPVDSGAIELSATGNMEAAGNTYSKGQELSCWTADIIWDGKKGGAGTPCGDGPHTVRLRVFKDEEEYRANAKAEWEAAKRRARRDLRGGGSLAWEAPSSPKQHKGFTLYVGDCGNVYGTFEIPAHHGLSVVWIDEHTMEIQVLP